MILTVAIQLVATNNLVLCQHYTSIYTAAQSYVETLHNLTPPSTYQLRSDHVPNLHMLMKTPDLCCHLTAVNLFKPLQGLVPRTAYGLERSIPHIWK